MHIIYLNVGNFRICLYLINKQQSTLHCLATAHNIHLHLFYLLFDTSSHFISISVDIMVTTDFWTCWQWQFFAKHNRTFGNSLVRWIYGAIAGALNWLATRAIAIANTHDDRERHWTDTRHCYCTIQTASDYCTNCWRSSAMAHHEQ